MAIDLFAGLGGWTEALLAEGYRCIGFDIERHEYGELRYPGQLVIQDVRTLHGSQFRDAALMVASPPCQFFSYTAMPWSRAKKLAADVRSDPVRLEKELELFNACFRIQEEACQAAGRHIPLIVENVRGAIPWVGRSRWNYGSFHLWGDVPALMPVTPKRGGVKSPGLDWSAHADPDYRTSGKGACFRDSAFKNSGFRFDGSGKSFQSESVNAHIKNDGGPWFNIGSPGQKVVGRNPDGRKQPGIGGKRNNGKGDAWFQDGAARHGSSSPARKAASALIAKIPEPLARHIAVTFYPMSEAA